jgi:hypothetical protein
MPHGSGCRGTAHFGCLLLALDLCWKPANLRLTGLDSCSLDSVMRLSLSPYRFPAAHLDCLQTFFECFVRLDPHFGMLDYGLIYLNSTCHLAHYSSLLSAWLATQREDDLAS